MLKIRNQFILAGLSVGLLAATVGSRADQIVQSFNIPVQTPPILNNIGANLFDSNLGSLTSVTLELVVNGTANIQVTNLNLTPANFTSAFTSFALNVTGPPGSTNYISTTLSANVAAGVAAPGVNNFNGVNAHFDSTPLAVPGGDFGSFEAPGGGIGDLPLVFSSGPSSSGGSGDPGVDFGGSGNVGGPNTFPAADSSYLQLIYNYTPNATSGAPEPGALALLIASASISVVGLRRRRAFKVA